MDMNKSLFISLFIFAMLVFCSQIVSATYYATNNFYEPATGSALSNVQILAYDCYADGSCSGLSDASAAFFNANSGSATSMQVPFPTRGSTQYFGEYFFKQCYLPMHSVFYTYGQGNAYGTYNIPFLKAANCAAPITELVIINSGQANQPIMINVSTNLGATTWSAFHRTNNLPLYIPSPYKAEYYSALIRVTVQITNLETGNTVFSQIQDLNIFEDTSQRRSFNWTPTSSGRFLATASTNVIDCQCSSSLQQQATKEFTIYDSNATGARKCYTILNNLTTNNPYPRPGENLIIYVDSLSNYQDELGQLTSSPTLLDLEIRDSAQALVYNRSMSVQAASVNQPITVTMPWTVASTGDFGVKITGVASSNLCTGINNSNETVTQNIHVVGDLPPSQNFQVTNIQCLANVVRNGMQACSISISASGTGACNERGNVIIRIRDYSTNQEYANCLTNSLSGSCSATYTIPANAALGTYTVYATAEKTGCTGDFDRSPTTSYNVLTQRYNIHDLRVYNDSGFSQQDYEFYRNETIYVSFRVVENSTLINIPGMVTQATLVSPSGGMSELERINESAGWYYYSGRIPSTHSFIGTSQVFTLAFNFSDNSGGMETITLNILNNPPENLMTDLSVEENTTTEFNLTSFGYDVEDNQNILSWALQYVPSIFTATLSEFRLLITSYFNQLGTAQITLLVTDLDNATTQKTINVTITETSGIHGIQIISSPPTEVVLEKANEFNVEYEYAVRAYNPDGETVAFFLSSAPSGMTINTSTGMIKWTPNSLGCFFVTVNAIDSRHSGSQSYTVCVLNPEEDTRPKEKLKIENFEALTPNCIKPGEELNVIVKFKNTGNYDMQSASIIASVQELGLISKKGPFKASSDESISKALRLDIPESANNGLHYLRLFVGDDTYQRIVYRDFIISNSCPELCNGGTSC